MSDMMPHHSRGDDAAFARALSLVRDLRARCPWDSAQTRETLRPYLVEETLELDQALRHGRPDARGPLEKVKEELQELEAELPPEGTAPRSPLPRVAEEIGDLLFAVVNLARKLAIDPRTALERANEKFRRRFERVERLAAERGVDVGRASLEKLDELWDEVKA